MYSGPTSGSIRASLKGQIPTGPTFHTVWRVVRRLPVRGVIDTWSPDTRYEAIADSTGIGNVSS
jgi:hypothetical protein